MITTDSIPQEAVTDFREIVADFLRAHHEGPGLIDCIDNHGDRYTSKFLYDLIVRARARLALPQLTASTDHQASAPGGDDEDREADANILRQTALRLRQSGLHTDFMLAGSLERMADDRTPSPQREGGLAALCLANDLDMANCGDTELARIWTKVEKIRAKQAAKPKHSPLPEATSPQPVEPAPGAGEHLTQHEIDAGYTGRMTHRSSYLSAEQQARLGDAFPGAGEDAERDVVAWRYSYKGGWAFTDNEGDAEELAYIGHVVEALSRTRQPTEPKPAQGMGDMDAVIDKYTDSTIRNARQLLRLPHSVIRQQFVEFADEVRAALTPANPAGER